MCVVATSPVGAVMSHIMEDGSEHPIGFVSRTLNESEKNYSQMDKEGAAVVFGLKKFHKYLFGRRFKIVTDHKPLLTVWRREAGSGHGIPMDSEMGSHHENL